jgi:6-phosphogluconolactonase (cycloisomerase 2 family)
MSILGSSRELRFLAASVLLGLILSACSNGNSGTVDSTPASSTDLATYKVSGTVAYEHPVAGKTVAVRDSSGRPCATATTASDGSYSLSMVICAPGPAVFYITDFTTPGGAPLISVTVPPDGKTAAGVVNIDPLTTLVAYDAAGLISTSSPPSNVDQVLAILPRVSAAQLQEATTQVLTARVLQAIQSAYGVSMNGFSPVTTPFAADGSDLDSLFEQYPLTAPTAASVQLGSSAGNLFVNVSLPTAAGSKSSVTSNVSYSVGGQVSGLSGGPLTMLLNGANPLTVNGDGRFTFPTAISSTYAVTISAEPAGQTCTVANGSGAGVIADVSSVNVVCSAQAYTIAGSVSGLVGGSQVTLANNGANPITVTADGAFVFTTPVAYGSSYSVTVDTEPTGQVCTLADGSGAGVTSNVTTVNVVCSNLTYTIGGSVSGLIGAAIVTLADNGANPITVTANGAFTFTTPVAYGGSYSVTVGTQPTGQVCTLANGSGAGVTANVATVTVVCSSLTYTLGGNVTGLPGGGQVTLANNGANPLTVAANGAFAFTTPVAYGGSYAVTVSTQPTGQICTVANGTGAGVTANVSTVNIVCSAATFNIGGSVTGMAGGTQVTLDNNGANPVTVAANGPFAFTTPVVYGGSYAVTVVTQPTGQICTASNGSGTSVATNVTAVNIVCSTATYTVGGNITGLASGAQVTIDNNGANPLTATASGAFSFTIPVAYGGSYHVTVGTQPNGQTCAVSNGTGTGVAADITDVAINCPDAMAYIYVANGQANNVLGYRFDLTTGISSSIPGSPWPAGANDRWVTTNTAGTFAYVTNQNGASISVYAINRSTGALTEVSGSPFPTGSGPASVALNPAGTFAYVAASGVSVFSIDQTTGALTEVSGSPLGGGASQIAINPAGTFAFVINSSDNTISVYSIDPTTGALSAVSGSPFGSANNPADGVTVNPAGSVLYVTNWTASVSAYAIDANTGALSEISGSPFTATYIGWGWQSLAVNPAGTLALVSTGNGGKLLSFSIDPNTGALTQLTGDAYGAYGYGGANYVVFNGTGTQAFVSNSWGLWVSVVNIDSTTGAATDVSGSPFGVDARPSDIAVVQP